MEPLDLVVNATVAVIDAGVLVAARRWPERAALVVTAGGCAALVLAAVLGLGLTGVNLFGGVRALCWVVLVHAPVVLIASGAIAWYEARRDAIVAVLAAVALIVAGLDATLVEPHALEVNHYAMSSAKLTDPFRIAVISDIQSDDYGAYESAAIDAVLAERPDLIVMPGDFVQVDLELHRYPDQAAKFRALAGRLVAPLGVFAVQGNVDWRHSWAEDLFSGTAVRAFEVSTTVQSGPIAITGLSFDDSFDVHGYVGSADRFHVVFGHGPDFALGDGGGDLLIAGHTHGGQIVVPLFGPPLTLSHVPRAWAAGGMHRLPDGRSLIVSRGIGMERAHAPRIRFNCRPEVVVIDVSPG